MASSRLDSLFAGLETSNEIVCEEGVQIEGRNITTIQIYLEICILDENIAKIGCYIFTLDCILEIELHVIEEPHDTILATCNVVQQSTSTDEAIAGTILILKM